MLAFLLIRHFYEPYMHFFVDCYVGAVVFVQSMQMFVFFCCSSYDITKIGVRGTDRKNCWEGFHWLWVHF